MAETQIELLKRVLKHVEAQRPPQPKDRLSWPWYWAWDASKQIWRKGKIYY